GLVLDRRGLCRARPLCRETDDEVADVDLVALADDRRLRDLAAVDVGAVRALEVGDDEATVPEEQPRVVLGDVPLREHQIDALHAADVDLVLVERLAALGSALFADDDREHSGPGRSLRGVEAQLRGETHPAYIRDLVLRRLK